VILPIFNKNLAKCAIAAHMSGANVILFRPAVSRSPALSLSIQTDRAELPHQRGQQ
jgi:hypothetical protein